MKTKKITVKGIIYDSINIMPFYIGKNELSFQKRKKYRSDYLVGDVKNKYRCLSNNIDIDINSGNLHKFDNENNVQIVLVPSPRQNFGKNKNWLVDIAWKDKYIDLDDKNEFNKLQYEYNDRIKRGILSDKKIDVDKTDVIIKKIQTMIYRK